MAKLPKELVQAPSFDSPLRRTSAPELTVVSEAGKPANTPNQVLKPTQERQLDSEPELLHRVTVRLSQQQWEAVQTESFRQRMLGRKTNASALIREIVDSWISGSGQL